MTGQIKITFDGNDRPKIEILGDINTRVYNALPIYLRRAMRRHRNLVRRGAGMNVDMSDKGTTIQETLEQKGTLPEPAPIPGAEEIRITPPVLTEQVSVEANSNNQESEGVQDGNDEGSGTIRADDEEPGSKEGITW